MDEQKDSSDSKEASSKNQDAQDAAWAAGDKVGSQMARNDVNDVSAVAEAGKNAGRQAAEGAGADAQVGEKPGQDGAVDGWSRETMAKVDKSAEAAGRHLDQREFDKKLDD